MALITKIDEVQAVMLVSNLDLDESIPDMATTQETRLFPYLGEDFSNALQAAYDAPLTASDEMKAAILRMQTALAPFAYADNLGTIHSRITSGGVRSMTTDSMPAVTRWAYQEVKSELLNKGYSSLEAMLAFLERNKDDYPEWAAGEGFVKRKSLLIKSGKDFCEYFHIHQPFRTYHLLLACMRDVDALHIIPMLGKSFYDSLKELEDPEEEETELITRLKYAIANLAIAQACDKLPVRIDESGFTVLSGFGDGVNNDKTAAAGAAMSALRSKATSDGQKYLARARKYLNANASAEVFAEYFSSDYYRDPNKKTCGRGNDRRTIFNFGRT